MFLNEIKTTLINSLSVYENLLKYNLENISNSIELITNTIKNNRKLLLCGNGSSAADCQRIASELVSRFVLERGAIPAIALNCNSSILTAIGNDYGFEYIYSRQIESFGNSGDTLLALSTSGNSKNIIKSIETAKKKGMNVIGMTGENGGEMNGMCDVLIKVPASYTPHIQECHYLISHIFCSIIENNLFSNIRKD